MYQCSRTTKMEQSVMSELIKEWYELLDANHVKVEPKAFTLLQMVMENYDITKKAVEEDAV
jgi:hypothetical protein